jgi:hypothetical protein
VASIVAGTGVVGELGAEGEWEGGIFIEKGVPAVAITESEGGGGDVLGDPVWIAGLAIERGQKRGRGGEIGNGSGEAVLEDARR